jgi:hypothetical protein
LIGNLGYAHPDAEHGNLSEKEILLLDTSHMMMGKKRKKKWFPNQM